MELFWSIVHKENQEVWRCVALIFVLLPWSTGKVLLMERFQKSHNTLKVDGGQHFSVKSGRPRDFLLNYSFISFRILGRPFSAINPYWQIMENLSRNFSEIFIFQVITQAVLLENSSIRIFWLKPYMICNIWSG